MSLGSRTSSFDYEIEYNEEGLPGLEGSVQQAETKPCCRIQDHYDKLQWIPSILACLPDTISDIDGIMQLKDLLWVIPISGTNRDTAAYITGILCFGASVISSGTYVKTGLLAIKDLLKGDLPEYWTPGLSLRQERVAKALGLLCVIPSSLYDLFSTAYFANQLKLSIPASYTLAALTWFSNISSEGIESYGNLRDLIKGKKTDFDSKLTQALYYGVGGGIGILGALSDTIQDYCPVVALAKAPYGSALQRLILCGAIPKILTSNFYVGQWSRDAIKEFAERLQKKQFTKREIATFCFSFFYAFVLGEAKRGLTASFLKSPGAELPFTLNNDSIETFGVFIMLREVINNIKFIYPMVNELIDYFQRKRTVQSATTDFTQPLLGNNTQTLFYHAKSNGTNGRALNGDNDHEETFEYLEPASGPGTYVPPPIIVIQTPALTTEQPETATASQAATKSAAPR